jgi:hypothetical protein
MLVNYNEGMKNVTLRVTQVAIIFFAVSSWAAGMDFSWVITPATSSTSEGHVLKMSGEINVGDYERFRSFVRKNLDTYKSNRFVDLSSNGGNVAEALKIAAVLRLMYPSISVTDGKCASSCFFLYLSGASRYAKTSSLLGVHRAYFDPKYFAGLRPEQARKKQNELTTIMNSILDDNGVPQSLKDKMNQTASTDIYWLTDRDVSALGLHPMWYEEYMIAKCGSGDAAENATLIRRKRDKVENTDNLLDDLILSYIKFKKCEDEVISAELSNLAKLLESPKR